jgi:hypothetical protein
MDSTVRIEHSTTGPSPAGRRGVLKPWRDGLSAHAASRSPIPELGLERRSVVVVLAAYALARLIVLATSLIFAAVRDDVAPVNVFRFWDGGWYLQIVEHGYPKSVPPEPAVWPPPGVAVPSAELSSNFFPLYPLVVRAISLDSRLDPAAVGVAVSIVAGGLAVLLVTVLVRRLATEAIAIRTGVLLSLFPGSVVLSVTYAEGLQFLFSALCLLALYERRWLLAGIAGALATASRPGAIALAAACAWAAGLAIWQRRDWRALAAPLIAPLGFIGYVGWLGNYTGDAEAWFRISRLGWGVRYGDFLEFVWPLRHPDVLARGYWHLWLGGLAVLALCALAVLRGARMPSVLWVYSGAILAPMMLSRVFGPRPRYLLLAFPLFFLLAQGWRRRGFVALAVLFAVLLAVETIWHLIPGRVAP